MTDNITVQFRTLGGDPLELADVEQRRDPFEASRVGTDDWRVVTPKEGGVWAVAGRGHVTEMNGRFEPYNSTLPDATPEGPRASWWDALHRVLG